MKDRERERERVELWNVGQSLLTISDLVFQLKFSKEKQKRGRLDIGQ